MVTKARRFKRVPLRHHSFGRRARHDAKGGQMNSNAVHDELRRLEDTSLDGQLSWELENGFELSPRESQGGWMR